MNTGARRFDDEVDRILRDRGWWSRRDHAEQNGYRAGYDSWGWGGAAPGGIDVRCVGPEAYEVAWVTASTETACLERFSSRSAMLTRAESLASGGDFIPN